MLTGQELRSRRRRAAGTRGTHLTVAFGYGCGYGWRRASALVCSDCSICFGLDDPLESPGIWELKAQVVGRLAFVSPACFHNAVLISTARVEESFGTQ